MWWIKILNLDSWNVGRRDQNGLITEFRGLDTTCDRGWGSERNLGLELTLKLGALTWGLEQKTSRPFFLSLLLWDEVLTVSGQGWDSGANLWDRVDSVTGDFESAGLAMLAACTDISSGSTMLDASLFHPVMDLVAGIMAEDSSVLAIAWRGMMDTVKLQGS